MGFRAEAFLYQRERQRSLASARHDFMSTSLEANGQLDPDDSWPDAWAFHVVACVVSVHQVHWQVQCFD